MDAQEIVGLARNVTISEIIWNEGGEQALCYTEGHIDKEVFLRAVELYHGMQLGIYDDQISMVQHEEWTSHSHCEEEGCDKCGGEAAHHSEYWIIASDEDPVDRQVTILRYD